MPRVVHFIVIFSSGFPALMTVDREELFTEITHILGPVVTLPSPKKCKLECYVGGMVDPKTERNELAEHVLKELGFDSGFSDRSGTIFGKVILLGKGLKSLPDDLRRKIYSVYERVIDEHPEFGVPAIVQDK